MISEDKELEIRMYTWPYKYIFIRMQQWARDQFISIYNYTYAHATVGEKSEF